MAVRSTTKDFINNLTRIIIQSKKYGIFEVLLDTTDYNKIDKKYE